MTKVELIAGGEERIRVETQEARNILARFREESNGKVVEKVDMSGCMWTREALDVMVPFLVEIAPAVRVVKLDDIIAGLMTEEGLDTLKRLAEAFQVSNLQELYLNHNALGSRAMERVHPFFENSNLEHLNLANCGLDVDSALMLKTFILSDGGRIAQSLKALVLDQNNIGVEGAEVIGEILPVCKKLEYFSYIGCRPSREGTQFICDGIQRLTMDCDPALRHINMEDCTLDEDAIETFSEALKKCSQLTFLNLNDCGLGQDGLRLLFNALVTANAGLTHLYLGTFTKFCGFYEIFD